ncbi:MAG TPA: T9SS type A sorting domain-containing protein [Flavobacteriales bacterium]|nr:T9SS type A sorting domain-containing protein [Flavobacteriales bacterium]
MKFNYLLAIVLAIIINLNAKAQLKPSFTTQSKPVISVPALSSMNYLPKPDRKGEVNPKRRSGQNIVIPGKGLPKGNDPLIALKKRSISHLAQNPLLTFEATHNGATPSDPTGAAGPNHYVVAYNTAFKIFDKNGNVLVNDTNLSTLFPGHSSDGDPIVLYDQFADRFLITNFDVSSTPNKLLVAVSKTADPVNDGWHIYAFEIPGTDSNNFIDYPKFSIWSDGYYVTSNKDASSADTSDVVFVMERDQMIAGAQTAQIMGFPLPGIVNNGFYSPSGFNVNGNQMPPAGNAPIIFMQDDSWAGVNQDHLKIWYVNVDWNTPSNSIISNPEQINTTAFNSVFNNGGFSNLPQPNGTDIDALQATIMFMTNYRRFANYNSVVLNFVVNTDGQGKAGIRWYELRQNNDGDPWSIYQEGTYIDPSNHNTFAGSINMDKFGNIGLGYTIVDSDQVPELHFTGRYASDPLSQMTISAGIVTPGVTSDPSNRYGDYAQLTVDPSDDKTFWFISEYFTNEGRADQVAKFKFASDYNYDIGISNITQPTDGILTAHESVSVVISNYGLQTADNFSISYQIDGNTAVTENFAGSIAPGETATYTFATTADLSLIGHTYNITATTNWSSDQDNTNDSASVSVTNLEPNDLGVTNIIAPVSGSNLSNAEAIQVEITNFGGASQSNVPVSYTLDGNTINEVAPGPFAPNNSHTFTFSQTADLSRIGTYNLSVATHLPNDSDPSNDSFSTTITHNICQPSGDCNSGDEITQVVFEDINNSSDCNGTGYQDFTNMSTDLTVGQTYDMTVTVGYSEEHFTAWIDFNDDFSFDASEMIVNDYEFGPNGSGGGTYTNTFSINIPAGANQGEHLMRLRTNWQAAVPDACQDVDYGETEDYKVNIVDANGIDVLQGHDIVLQTLENNHFLINLQSPNYQEDMILQVFTIGGKQIVYHPLKNQNGQYAYDLNMQYVAKGVYLLKIGNKEVGKVKKIIVK